LATASTEDFWLAVYKNPSFKDLAVFVLSSLSVPVSNATVERIFSLVSAVKTKVRNCMQLHLLDSIIRIRSELLLSQKCCNDFEPTQRMLDNFTPDKVYASHPDTNAEGATELENLEELLA
jgi:hypothetical protein